LNPEPHDVQPQNFVDEDGFYNENLAHNVKLRHSVRSLPMHLVPQRLLQRRLKASVVDSDDSNCDPVPTAKDNQDIDCPSDRTDSQRNEPEDLSRVSHSSSTASRFFKSIRQRLRSRMTKSPPAQKSKNQQQAYAGTVVHGPLLFGKAAGQGAPDAEFQRVLDRSSSSSGTQEIYYPLHGSPLISSTDPPSDSAMPFCDSEGTSSGTHEIHLSSSQASVASPVPQVDAPPLSSDPTWASEILEAGAKVSFAENSGACDNSGDGAIVSTEASPELGSSTKCKDIPELLSPKIKIHTPEGSSKTYDEEASQDNREERINHDEICFETRKMLANRLMTSDTEHKLDVEYKTQPPLSCHLGSSSTDNATRYGGPQQESADEQRGSSYSLTVVLPITPSAEDSKELKRRISNGGPRPVAPLTEARNQETDIQLHVEYPSSNLPEGIENQQPQLSKTHEANS
jgi:hypothetical protein